MRCIENSVEGEMCCAQKKKKKKLIMVNVVCQPIREDNTVFYLSSDEKTPISVNVNNGLSLLIL